MKRYRTGYFMGVEEDSDGPLVAHKVAQELYDALKPFTRKESLRELYSFEINQAIKAISLADGDKDNG